MKRPLQILTTDQSIKTMEITWNKSETYDMGKAITEKNKRYSTATDVYVNGAEDPIVSLWTLGELWELTVFLWTGAIKAALGRRN